VVKLFNETWPIGYPTGVTWVVVLLVLLLVALVMLTLLVLEGSESCKPKGWVQTKQCRNNVKHMQQICKEIT
jgi:hypothetical protein